MKTRKITRLQNMQLYGNIVNKFCTQKSYEKNEKSPNLPNANKTQLKVKILQKIKIL